MAAIALVVVTPVGMGIITWGMPIAGTEEVMVEMWLRRGAGGKCPSVGTVNKRYTGSPALSPSPSKACGGVMYVDGLCNPCYRW